MKLETNVKSVIILVDHDNQSYQDTQDILGNQGHQGHQGFFCVDAVSINDFTALKFCPNESICAADESCQAKC